MANFAPLEEYFLGAAAGSAISMANSFITNTPFGTGGPGIFDAEGPGGTSKSLRVESSVQTSIHKVEFTPLGLVYVRFYFKPMQAPTSSMAILNWQLIEQKIGDLRLLPDLSLQLRNLNSEVWAGTAVALNEWHRVELRIQPGSSTGHEVKIFSNRNLHGTTESQGSGLVAATAAGATSLDNIRFGVISSNTTRIKFAAFKGDTSQSPGPATVQNQVPVAAAGSNIVDLKPYESVTLDGSESYDLDGSITSYNWTQVSGSPTVDVSGTGPIRSILAPATMDGTTIIFGLTVTDDQGATSDQDTMSITVNRHSQFVVAPDGVTRKPVRSFRVNTGGTDVLVTSESTMTSESLVTKG